jgi:hypothetical protein
MRGSLPICPAECAKDWRYVAALQLVLLPNRIELDDCAGRIERELSAES